MKIIRCIYNFCKFAAENYQTDINFDVYEKTIY